MTAWTTVGRLKIATVLHDFAVQEALPGTGIEPARLWAGLESLLTDLAPKNAALLGVRDEIQAKIDAWHVARRGQQLDQGAYIAFLKEIGYLLPEGEAFNVATTNVDAEIATMAGPQLVVPITNARYALNAANARWGSLYDALYGTDAIAEDDGAARGSSYNSVRGTRVIAWARTFLDQAVPLAQGSHSDAASYTIE